MSFDKFFSQIPETDKKNGFNPFENKVKPIKPVENNKGNGKVIAVDDTETTTNASNAIVIADIKTTNNNPTNTDPTNSLEVANKYCRECKQTLPIIKFHKNGKYINPICAICRQKLRKATRYERKEGTKYCAQCTFTLPTKQFHSDASQPDGLNSSCIECRKKQCIVIKNTYDGNLKNLFKDLVHNAKNRFIKEGDARRPIKVYITIEDIKTLYTQNDKCALSGIKMTHEAKAREERTQHILNKYNISVDRIDSNKDYTLDNIRLVCGIVNRMRSDLTDNEFFLIISAVTERNRQRIHFLLNDSKISISDIKQNDSITAQLIDEQQSKIVIDTSTSRQKYSCKLDNFIKKLLLNTKHNINKRSKDLECTITENDIKKLYESTNGKCALTGISMTHIAYQNSDKVLKNKWNMSIDRVNSTKGYIPNNIQLVCSIINKMKGDLRDSKILLVCDKIYRTRRKEVDKSILDFVCSL